MELWIFLLVQKIKCYEIYFLYTILSDGAMNNLTCTGLVSDVAKNNLARTGMLFDGVIQFLT